MIENDPGKLAVAGDWHGNTNYALRAIQYVEDYDGTTIMHTGDFGFNFENKFVQKLTDALNKRDINLYFVDGNHENFEYLYGVPLESDGTRKISERIIHLPRGFRWEWYGQRWLALGGATSVDYGSPHRRQGFGWWPEESITTSEFYAASEPGDVDVMITHDAPAGFDLWKDNADWISEGNLYKAQLHRRQLRAFVDYVNPSKLFHGHYHTRYTHDLEIERGILHIEGLDCDQTPFPDNIIFPEF